MELVLVLFSLSLPPLRVPLCRPAGEGRGGGVWLAPHCWRDTPAPHLLIRTLSLKSPTQQRLVATLFLQARVLLRPLEFCSHAMICAFELNSFLHDSSSLCVLLWGPKVFVEPGRDRNSLFVRTGGRTFPKVSHLCIVS